MMLAHMTRSGNCEGAELPEIQRADGEVANGTCRVPDGLTPAGQQAFIAIRYELQGRYDLEDEA